MIRSCSGLSSISISPADGSYLQGMRIRAKEQMESPCVVFLLADPNDVIAASTQAGKGSVCGKAVGPISQYGNPESGCLLPGSRRRPGSGRRKLRGDGSPPRVVELCSSF